MRIGVRSLGTYPEKERTRESEKAGQPGRNWTLSKCYGEDSQLKILATFFYPPWT